MRLFYFLFVFIFALHTVAPLRAQCPITVNAGEDKYLCAPPTPTQLDGSIDGDYLNFSWSPLTGMTGSTTLSPTVNVTTTTTYVLTGRAVDVNNNLISNGDFEIGNTDFTSDYLYSPGDLWPEGVYDVLTNPQSAHANFAPCSDHTSGSGNMMAVNGAGIANQNVWCQTVNVTPNTQYAFSAWVTTLVTSSPARLQFSINGTPLGPVFNAPGSTCNWLNFYQLWNSGNNTSATICIVNQNTATSGNDFALDDLVFSPTCEVKDSVTVRVVNITAVAAPQLTFIPCEGANITLNGNGSSTGPDITYNWETDGGNIVSGHNTLNPVVNATGTYTLTVTFNNGFVECTKTATITVVEHPNKMFAWITPPVPLGCGSSTSTLYGYSNQPANTTYQWTAGPGGNIVSGAESQTAIVDKPGTYTLLVTNTVTGCTAEVSTTVTAATDPPSAVATVPGPITCQEPQRTLSGAGSSTGSNITYAWTALVGGNIVGGQNAIDAVVNGPGTYVLKVTNTSNGCTAVDTAIVYSTATPPGITIDTPGVFNCAIDTLLLSAALSPAAAVPAWTATGGGNVTAGANTLQPQIAGAGVYILLATDTITGCTATDTVSVAADLAPPAAVALPADTITCQQASVTLSGAGSQTGAGISYLWTASGGGNIVSGDTTLSPLVNAAGTYTLIVTNSVNHCSDTASVPVFADANAIVAVANAPDTLNCADTLVTLNANGSSPIPGLVYAWTTSDGLISGGAGTPTPTAGAPGTYQLLLTNPANGCTATDMALVIRDVAAPPIGIAVPDTLTCAQPEQTLLGQNNSPAGHFTYTWTTANGGNILSGDSTLTPLVNAAGDYTLTAINLNNGCTAQTSVTVSIEAGTPVAIAAAPGPITCADPTRVISSAGSSAGANFQYAWTTAGGNIVSGADSPNPLVDAPGDYSLTITNTANGCTATATVNVGLDNAAPPANAGPDGLLTCADPVFSLSANNGLPTGNFQFSWQTTNGSFLGNPDSMQVSTNVAGTYTLSVFNPANGCLAIDTAIVTANQVAPAVQILPPAKLTCIQTAVTLNTGNGSPNFQYQWQTTNGQFVSGQTTETPEVDAPGQYDLLVTDTVNGCTQTATVTVAQDIAIPLADAGPSPTLNCVLTQTPLQGAVEPGAAIDVLWTAGNGGNIVSGAATATPVVDQPGDYLLTVTNTDNGCTNTATVAVFQNIVDPVVNAGQDATLSCTVKNISLNATAGVSGTPVYLWTAGPGGHIVSGANSLIAAVDSPGLYTLLVTDATNGCTASDTVEVFKDADAPIASVAVPGPLTCVTQQLILQGFGNAGANYTQNWTAANGGNIVNGQNSFNPTVNEPGLYTLRVTNLSNGCTATAQAAVSENVTPPVVSIAPPGILTCSVKSLSLNGAPAGPGHTYFWDTANGQIVSGGTTAKPLISLPGIYILTVTAQANGCTASASTTVISDTAPPLISAASPPTLTCIQTQVTLNGAVSQPANNFSTGWTTADGHFVSGQNTLSPTVDAPGLYVLTVQNLQNGCTSTASAPVIQNITPPLADAGAAPTLTCAQPQASLDGSGSSGAGTLSFAWAGPQITSGAASATPMVSGAGLYTVTVTDAANGCTDSDTITVLINKTPPLAVIAPPLLRTCLRDTVLLDGGASSNGPAFTVSWTTQNGHFTGGQNTLSPRVDAAGVYTLTLVDQQNGCSASATATVGEDRVAPHADAGPPDELHCNHEQSTLQGASNTPGPLTYAWSTPDGNILDGAATLNPSVDAPGAYLLTVTDPDNGCTASDAVTVTEIPLPDFDPTLIQPDCHRPKGSVSIGTVSGGTPPFRYSFDGGQSFSAVPTAGNLAPGVYQLAVQDANGCSAEAEVQIFEPFFPSLSLPEFYLIKQGDSVQLFPVTIPPTVALADWQWTPADGLSCDDCPTPWAKPLQPTAYTLTITDLNGCTATGRTLVRVDRNRYLYAPNIFSPNGDGINDMFLLYGRGVAEIEMLQLFDRWGNRVFERKNFQPNDESLGWNGNYRGQAVNPAVYVWQAVVRFADGQSEVFSGDVTVLR